jgi:methylated-DNA-[protein]-cysteine S-methyltransferase
MKSSALFSVKDQLEKESYFQILENSPLGNLCISASNKGLRFIKICIDDQLTVERPNEHTASTYEQLNQYFEKQRNQFDIVYDFSGYSDFSIRVWQQLLEIPFGKTISYLQLAIALGDAKVIRAAGTANGRNPIPIIIPCHRVIGSDGSMTGYALGIDKKEWLLGHENPRIFGSKQGELF